MKGKEAQTWSPETTPVIAQEPVKVDDAVIGNQLAETVTLQVADLTSTLSDPLPPMVIPLG
ncbi:MAG: hypothetical protein AAB875_02245 [Patescibacteria group bacterium]